jgi:hypothetical protein
VEVLKAKMKLQAGAMQSCKHLMSNCWSQPKEEGLLICWLCYELCAVMPGKCSIPMSGLICQDFSQPTAHAPCHCQHMACLTCLPQWHCKCTQQATTQGYMCCGAISYVVVAAFSVLKKLITGQLLVLQRVTSRVLCSLCLLDKSGVYEPHLLTSHTPHTCRPACVQCGGVPVHLYP